MALKKYSPRVPSEYQEIEYISSNDGNGRYINTGLLGSDLTDCEIEAVMKNDTTDTSYYNLNGAYLQGSSAQFGTVATSSTKCRVSINFAFSSAISVTDLALSQFHKIYISNGLQKVNDDVVGNNSFGTLVNYPFLLFARSNDNQGGYTSCFAMSLKSFIVKRDGIYIRNYVPVRRKSDNKLGLYDIVNNTFASSATAYEFTGGNDVDNWHDIPCHKYETATETIQSGDTIYADGQPITTYTLKGNEEHTGTPSPQNPVMPQGTGNKTANLFNEADLTYSRWTDSSGNVSTSAIYGAVSKKIPVTNSTYTVKAWGEAPYSIGVCWYDSSDNFISRSLISPYTTQLNTLTAPQNAAKLTYQVSHDTTLTQPLSSAEVNGFNVMLAAESTQAAYEPYGYKIPISSAQGSAVNYLGSTASNRQIKKVILTGTESGITYAAGNAPFRIPIVAMKYIDNNSIIWICSHYRAVPNSASWTSYNELISWSGADKEGDNVIALRIRDTNITSLDDFKAFLAQEYANGTPVTVWYVLKDEQTGMVNEPLMKIGDYADTLSNATSIPTTEGANSITVDTTVQPSEFSATWTGWHNASVQEYTGGAGNQKFDYTTMASGITGHYLSSAGVETASAAWAITDYIPCNGQSFTLGKIGGNAPSICLYDSNKTFIAGQAYNTGGADFKNDITVTASQNAKYIRFSYYIASPADDLSTIMLNEGTTALPYESYEYGWV